MGNPLVGTHEKRVFFSNSISRGIPIFTAGPISPIFIFEEVHSILANFGSEPILSVGTDILPEDLSAPGKVFLELSSSSLSGGIDSGIQYLNPELFSLKVLVEPHGRLAQGGVVSPSSSRETKGRFLLSRKNPSL